MSVNTANDIYSQLGIKQQVAPRTERRTELGEADFLRLMTEQLKNQDPLKPLGSTEFLGQLAQFSTVKGIQSLGGDMQNVSTLLGESQALQAANMVGHDAYLVTDKGLLGKEGVSGSVAATAAGTLTVQVADESGKVVRTFNVEARKAGEVDFTWDGRDGSGQALPAGTYTFTAKAGNTAVDVQIATRIESISFTASGMVLNLAGIGATTFDKITRIS